ncbi:MAG: efflux RND transporter periplasmic adaptor subunit [Burkholderiales bacterium]|nr:efflux RND transporter periplasmic adaptor subunit [Burkholderiales bacterium]
MKINTAIFLLALTSVAQAETSAVALVQTVAPRQAPLPQTVSAYGTVAFVQNDLTNISLPYAAQVTRLSVGNGQAVKRGATLFEVATDPNATLSFQQAETAVTLARGELQRTQALYTEHLATQSQVATAQKALTDAEHTFAAQRQLSTGAATQRITAPSDGIVVNLTAAQGDRIAAGAAVLQLGRASTAGTGHVMLGVEPSDSMKIRPGMAVELAPLDGATGTGASKAFFGRISAVRSAINPQTRLVDVVVDIPTSQTSGLLPGMQVRARITTENKAHWIVPRSTVQRDARGDYLFQVNNGKARRVNVLRAAEQDSQIGVDGPLNPAQTIVSLGNYELKDGMAVREAVR